MNNNQLQYFIEVADTGSMHKAAERLYASHQCISTSIRNLEKEFGAELLERSKQGVWLTDAGKAVYDMAQQILDLYEGTRRAIQPASERKNCKLRITAAINTTLGPFLAVIQKFGREHQDVALAIGSTSPYYAVERLDQGLADIVYVAARQSDSESFPRSVEVISKYSDRQYALLPYGHPLAGRKSLALRDVARFPIVAYRQMNDSEEDPTFEDLWNLREPLDVAMETDDINLYIQEIASGVGVGLASEVMVSSEVYKAQFSKMGLVAVQVREGFGLSIYCLCRKDASKAQHNLFRELDTMVSAELRLKRIKG